MIPLNRVSAPAAAAYNPVACGPNVLAVRDLVLIPCEFDAHSLACSGQRKPESAVMNRFEPMKAGSNQAQVVPKPWGHEVIWAHTPLYVGKLLHIKAGHALSLQYHERKDETIHLLRGELRFWAGPAADQLNLVGLKPGDSYRVTVGTVHRMEAVTDVDILEASTPDLDDVVRLEDRYGRS
jgi:mannose-6-phosphate isomerase-like protein (cupin superfamily)